MVDKNKVYDVIVSFLKSKWGMVAMIGSAVIGLDSFLGSILNFPDHYKKFKNEYVYDHFLNGTWTTSTDYVLDHKELHIPYDQPLFILDIRVDSKDNSVDGEAYAFELCETVPLTYIFRLHANEPSFYNIFFNRRLELSFLINGEYEHLASFIIEDINEKLGVLKLETIDDVSNKIPKFIYLTNKINSVENDLDELLERCQKYKSSLIQKIRKELANEEK